MSKWFLIASAFFRRGVKKHRDFLENNDSVIFILIIFVAFLISLKSSSGQGQQTLLGEIVRDYVIEETAAFINPASQASENELFLSQKNSFSEPDKNLPRAIFQEAALLPYQSLTSIFDTEQRNQVIKYTVQPGDNLSQIASDFGISVNSLIWANNLKDSDYLSSGQELKIPPVSGVIHIVKQGDTVAAIAKRYSAEAEKIFSFNNLPKDGTLGVGEELVVPGGKIQIGSQYVAYSSRVRFARLPDLGGFFILPTQGFNWGRIHGRNGVDIANICGTPVYAAAEGTIIASRESGWNGGAGKYVKISHGNEIYTLYGHLSRLLAGPGQNVSKGQLIGLIGSTGRSTGCHLHFEVHGARNPLARY